MSTVSSELHAVSRSRLRGFVWPREHGAWGMLLVPLVTGAWVGFLSAREIASLVLFSVMALALLCLRTPVEAWLEASPFRTQSPAERQAVLRAMTLYGLIAGVTLAVLLWLDRLYGLLVFGAAVALIFVAQLTLRRFGRPARMLAQVLGSLGLTSTAAGAYYVVTRQLDSTALVLWAANWLFAFNQIHFVRLRIHAARAATVAEKLNLSRNFLLGEALTGLMLSLAWSLGYFPGLALLAFVPVFIRGHVWLLSPRSRPLDIHRLGFGELAHALAFGVLLILGFHIYRG